MICTTNKIDLEKYHLPKVHIHQLGPLILILGGLCRGLSVGLFKKVPKLSNWHYSSSKGNQESQES